MACSSSFKLGPILRSKQTFKELKTTSLLIQISLFDGGRIYFPNEAESKKNGSVSVERKHFIIAANLGHVT